MHSTSENFMRFVYMLYVTECVVQRSPSFMVCMELSKIEMCFPFAQMFKLADLMCSFNAFRLKSLSPWNTSMLKPLALYMLVIFFNCFMILSALFEI